MVRRWPSRRRIRDITGCRTTGGAAGIAEGIDIRKGDELTTGQKKATPDKGGNVNRFVISCVSLEGHIHHTNTIPAMPSQ